MKIHYLKALMPLIAIMFAIGSSVVTKASEKSVLAITNGYVPNSVPCVNPTQCCNIGATVCSVYFGGQSYQLFGKFTPVDQTCMKTVFRC